MRPKDLTFIAPSCIGDGVGMGLFAKVNIKKGTLFPGAYSGTLITPEQYISLLDEIEAQPHATTLQQKSDSDFIRHLRRNYGIKIEDASSSSSSEQRNRQRVDWQSIHKGITDYAFEGEDENDNLMVTVLPVYNFEGKPVYDTKNPENPYILMNEPPNVESFYNPFLGARQKSCVNVATVLPTELRQEGIRCSDAFIRFRANQNIYMGTELFICYGPTYDRPYDINMDSECGCGMYEQVSGHLTGSVTRRAYYEGLHKFGRILPEFINRESKRDSRILAYLNIVRKK